MWKFIFGCLVVFISGASFALPSDVNNPQGALWNLLETGRTQEAESLEAELKKVLITAPITRIAPLGGGVSSSWLVYFENNVVAVLKSGDADVERSSQREAAAYVVDRALGLNMVPVTVLREIKGLTYSLQLYYPAATIETLVSQGVVPEFKTSRNADLGLFDYVINNVDRDRSIRHNTLSGKEGRLVAIDHARTFFLTDEFDLTLKQDDLDEASREFRDKLARLNIEKLAMTLKEYLTEEQVRDIRGRVSFVKINLESLALESYPQTAERKNIPRFFQAPPDMKSSYDLSRMQEFLNPYSDADPFAILEKFTSYGNIEKDPAFIHVAQIWPKQSNDTKSLFLKLTMDIQARFNPQATILKSALSLLKRYPQDLPLLEKVMSESLIQKQYPYFLIDLSKETRFTPENIVYLKKILWSDVGPSFVRLFMIGTSLDKVDPEFRKIWMDRVVVGLARGELSEQDTRLLFTQELREGLRFILNSEMRADRKGLALGHLKNQLESAFAKTSTQFWQKDYIATINQTYSEIMSSLSQYPALRGLRCEGLF